MLKSATWLLDSSADVYSQTGEDGIIGAILDVLPETDNWCVEFGAWDGQHLSNTRNLIEGRDYSAVLIEGNTSKFQGLKSFYSEADNIHTVNQYVGFEKADGLDQILQATPIPENFDFLSIDIDGNDYHVWNAVEQYKPKAICIEFNPTVPTEVDFIQPADPNISQGASLSALTKLGKEKGYELVCVMRFNALFVRSEYYQLFEIEDNSPQNLRTDLTDVTYLFSGYDGKVFLQGYRELPWHGVKLNESRIQHIPGFLQHHPASYSKLSRSAFKLFKITKAPRKTFDKLLRVFDKFKK